MICWPKLAEIPCAIRRAAKSPLLPALAAMMRMVLLGYSWLKMFAAPNTAQNANIDATTRTNKIYAPLVERYPNCTPSFQFVFSPMHGGFFCGYAKMILSATTQGAHVLNRRWI